MGNTARSMVSALIVLVSAAMAAEFDDAVKEGYQNLSAKQFEKAAAAFRRSYTLANGDAFKQAGALFGEGVALFRGDAIVQAEEVLSRGLALRPNDRETLYYLGYCRFRQQDMTNAIALMRRSFSSAKKSSDRSMVIHTICSFYQSAGLHTNAIQELSSIDTDEYTPKERFDACMRRGDFWMLEKNGDEAVLSFERALQIADEHMLSEADRRNVSPRLVKAKALR